MMMMITIIMIRILAIQMSADLSALCLVAERDRGLDQGTGRELALVLEWGQCGDGDFLRLCVLVPRGQMYWFRPSRFNPDKMSPVSYIAGLENSKDKVPKFYDSYHSGLAKTEETAAA